MICRIAAEFGSIGMMAPLNTARRYGSRVEQIRCGAQHICFKPSASIDLRFDVQHVAAESGSTHRI
jgi:hypothetical protein